MKKVQLFYDALCVVCANEIKLYKKWDQDKKIDFIDISHPQFSAVEYNLDPKLVKKYLHIKKQDGTIVTGVDSFIEIWDAIDCFKLLSWIAKTTIGKFLLNIGYYGFVVIRPYLPRYKNCDSHHCDIR